MWYNCDVEYLEWSAEKNARLKAQRGISFEEIILCIAQGGLLDILVHPDRERYPGQRVLVVDVDNYVYLVPFVESDEGFFLKTIIPSRKATREYLEGERNGTR